MAKKEKTTKYGLLIKKTGKLAGISRESITSEGSFCGNIMASLTGYEESPFLVDDPKKLVVVLSKNHERPWECDEERPSWGAFKPDDLVPVKVTVETTLEPIEVKLPIDLQDCLVYVADSTAVRAGELVGKNLPKGH